jgi:hypothetical protein
VPRSFPFKLLILGGLVNLLFSSCFKDVDFSQGENIVLAPDLSVDLLYYQLDETDFFHSGSGEYTPVIRDTVRLEFLDDDYIQDGLQYAEFRFVHKNRFPNNIKTNIRFLGSNGRNQFNIAYTIPAGSATSSAVIDTIHIMQGNDIVKVRRSLQMLVEHEIVGGGKDLEGELDFQSKGLFKFEF